jgi:hypothetical protein
LIDVHHKGKKLLLENPEIRANFVKEGDICIGINRIVGWRRGLDVLEPSIYAYKIVSVSVYRSSSRVSKVTRAFEKFSENVIGEKPTEIAEKLSWQRTRLR